MKTPILKRSAAIITSLLVLTGSGIASAADLMAIYRAAVSQDPVLASARATFEAAKEASPQARAANLPNISLSGNLNRINSDSDTALGSSSSNYTSKGYTLSLSQPIWRSQNWISVDQADLQVKQAEAVFADARQNIITRVAQAYFDVLFAQDKVDFSAAQKKALAEALAQAKRNFEVGTSTIVDTYEAQARYDLAVSTEIADQNDLVVKRTALQQLIGKSAPALSTLRETTNLPAPQPADMEAWVKSAEDASPTVAQSMFGYEIAKRDVDRNKAGHYPTLDLVGSYGYSDQSTTTTKSTSIGLQLNIPLYQGGGTQSRIRQALSQRERAEQDLENAKRSVGQNVRSQYSSVTSGIAQVKALEASLVSSRASLDSTILGKDVGVRTNVDVLNAQQQVFQTRRDLQQARYNTILAQLRLKAAAGRLSEDDLAEVNRLLQN